MNTIAAISTPAGHGGIGIIRISGDKSLEIVKKIFVPKNNSEYKPYTIKFGHIVDKDQSIIDQALVSYFKAPKTYTGEDVIEINVHGGMIVLSKILELVLQNGAQMAEPGEFTKRAFLNGKIDLTQAEAVIDMINTKTYKEQKAASRQLEGVLGSKIKEIKDEIVDMLIDIEANIDYPEYDIEETTKDKMIDVLSDGKEKLAKLEESFESGKILKEGINTAIIGKPNVGKSSLLNALLNEERAIVTDVAGTTRDTIEEYITIKGIPLKLVDTAGIRETYDVVEQIGVSKTKKALEDADLILIMLDATKELEEEDRKLLEEVKNKNHIILINKIDVANKIDKKELNDINVIEISAKTREGLDRLEQTIEEMFNVSKLEVCDSVIVTNTRHKDLIKKARVQIEEALNTINENLPIDMVSINLQVAITSLGEIIGENVSEDVINGIFKKFCVGK